MMAALSAWLFRKHCLQHADPLFDRDENGRAVFRCPECLHTWPILPNFEPKPLRPAALVINQERRAERRTKPSPQPRPAAVAVQPQRLGPLHVM